MLKIDKLGLGYDSKTVLSSVSFELAQGEIGCILGPSGCGKTSLLRAIAGFKAISEGDIFINNNKVAAPDYSLSVDKRNVGVVFQDYALFPHMSVHDNVAYGLNIKDKTQAAIIIAEYIDLVGLSDHADKYPHQLSGGQQQRVALARALAPKPDLLLLDEPFSSLDPELRASIAEDVRNIIKQNGTTALLITHDQQEAFTVSDKIGVLNNGTCEQWSSAYELYHQPKTQFIAKFIGEGTFISGTIVEDQNGQRITTEIGEFALPLSNQYQHDQNALLLVRPDDLMHDDESDFKALIEQRTFRGASILYQLRVGIEQEKVYCLTTSHHNHKVGEHLGIILALQHVICFPDNR